MANPCIRSDWERQGFGPWSLEPLEAGMATHPSVGVWEKPWTGRAGRRQSTGLKGTGATAVALALTPRLRSDPTVFPTNCTHPRRCLSCLLTPPFSGWSARACLKSTGRASLPSPTARALPYLASVLTRASLLPIPQSANLNSPPPGRSGAPHPPTFASPGDAPANPAPAPRQPTANSMHRTPHTGVPAPTAHFQTVLQSRGRDGGKAQAEV